MSYCSKCGEFLIWDSHRCKPRWVATRHLKDGKLDFEWCGTRVFATDAQEAAEKYCEQYDAGGDYDIIGSGECEPVYVQSCDGGPVTVWRVTAEAQPVYSASESDAEVPEVVGDDEEYGPPDQLDEDEF